MRRFIEESVWRVMWITAQRTFRRNSWYQDEAKQDRKWGDFQK